MIETAADRRALASAWGDSFTSGTATVDGQFTEDYADALGAEGTSPMFLALAADLAAAGVGRDSILTTVTTHDGRTRGPFVVVSVQPQEDGAFIMLALRQSA